MKAISTQEPLLHSSIQHSIFQLPNVISAEFHKGQEASHHRKHQSNGFVGHGVEIVLECDAIAGTVVKPDKVDRLLDNGVLIRQPVASVVVDEGRVCLEIVCVRNVVIQTVLSLARVETVVSLNKRRNLLLHIGKEGRSYVRELFLLER